MEVVDIKETSIGVIEMGLDIFNMKKKKLENLSTMKEKRYMRKDMEQSADEASEMICKGSKKMSDDNLAKIRTLPGPKPKAMDHFYDLAEWDAGRLEELKEWKKKGGKVVGTLCVFTPNELILASGAKIVRLCSGHYDMIHPANELLGDAGLCPLVKASLGGKMVQANPYFELCDLVIGPATCDGKTKLGEILSDFVPVLMLNVPRVKTGETTSKLWLEECAHLLRRLEDLTGKKVKRKDLLRVVEDQQEAYGAFGRLLKTRKSKNLALWGRDFMFVSQLYLWDDPMRWAENCNKLAKEVEELQKKGESVVEDDIPRVILGGSPIIWPNWKFPNIIEESEGVIVMDELCTSSRLLLDPLVINETTYKALFTTIAERYLYPCTCPCFTPNDERSPRIENMVNDYGAEGVIYHVLRGCHLNNLEASRIDLYLRKRTIPMLKIESEYDEGDIEQVRTRIEAFLEMIVARREYS